ncbi:MAG: hypothetical protein RIR48_1904 [Bacteroidota bacterium]|jgi:hypothetical protein
MILPSDKEYLQTKRIILGKEKMKPEFAPLAEWIDKTFDVKTMNIIYDTLDNKTPRIQICFKFEKEKNKFLTHDISYFDKTKQKAIGLKFTEIIKQKGLSRSNSFISNLFGLNKKGIYLTDNVFVIYGAFEPVAKLEATYKITQSQIEDFIKSFDNKDIWTVSIGFAIPTFFMYTDEKVKQYDKPEIKSMWADKYYEFVKSFDEFNCFKRSDLQVMIDSKENFDNNYQSNWYYYYK